MGKDEDVILRPGTPADVERMTALHFLCFEPRDHLATLLGRRFIRDMYAWFLSSDKTFSYCAWLSHELVGFSTVCLGPYHRLLFRQKRGSVILGLLAHPWLLFRPDVVKRLLLCRSRSNSVDDFLAAHPDAAIYAMMAIRTDRRGTGLNRRLNEIVVRECRVRGWNKLLAVVYKDNIASRKSSEKSGFRLSPLSAGSDDKVVYLLDLGAAPVEF